MSLESAGFEAIPSVLPAQDVTHLLALLSGLKLAPRRGGIRHIERLLPEIAALARAPRLMHTSQRSIYPENHDLYGPSTSTNLRRTIGLSPGTKTELWPFQIVLKWKAGVLGLLKPACGMCNRQLRCLKAW